MFGTLRPGFLVSVKTSVSGNVRYSTQDLPLDFQAYENADTVAQVTRWETTKTVTDPEEHERALKSRSLARSAIQTVCAHSAFGLLCPEQNVQKLTDAVAKARAIADVFNRNASVTRLSVNVLVGRIAPDDVEAVKAINSEIRDLVETMAQGLAGLDVQKVRDAANKARSVSQMLDANAGERVAKAIEVARRAARDIVKAGEEGAVAIDEVAIKRLSEARLSFLDIDSAAPVGEAEGGARGVDLGDVIPELTPEQEQELQDFEQAENERQRLEAEGFYD